MKAFVDTKINSRGIIRIAEAIKRFSPENITFVDDYRDADVVVIHVNGRLEHLKREIEHFNKPYILAQYVLQSSLNPDALDWAEVWQKAEMVWSYYNLAEKVPGLSFNFYHSPLGVDDAVFKRKDTKKEYTICTTGLSYLTESVRESYLAAKRTGGKSVHIGYKVGRGVECLPDLTDEEVATVYNKSKYVSGLRRIEGFELPAAEGLLCGARPVMFDRSHYRQWFGSWAEYIPELPRPQVEASLEKLFSREYRPVNDGEIAFARIKFSWKIIMEGFWSKL